MLMPLSEPVPPLDKTALFLDFDGTLVDIAPTPDGISVPSTLSSLLRQLYDACGGAIAIVSGRAVADLEAFLPNYVGTIVGGHGAEFRRDGILRQHAITGNRALPELCAEASRYVQDKPGLIVEQKPTGLVLHYRKAPDLHRDVEQFMSQLATSIDGLELHQAKMAIELRPDDIGKDKAVSHLVQTAPFLGKKAVFFGDDATDEPAMGSVLEAGGMACKVGGGESCAPVRFQSPSDVRRFLQDWIGAGERAWPDG